MDPTPLVNLGPLLQYGFAGFALIQFAAGVWICLKGLAVLSDLKDVIAANAAAMGSVEKRLDDLSDRIEGTPCRMTLDQLRDLVRRLQPQG